MAGKAGLRRDSKYRALRRGESIRANGKYQLNLWKANELIFLESGILPEHMAITNVCTHCNSKILYSHRTMGNNRGNLCAFLALK